MSARAIVVGLLALALPAPSALAFELAKTAGGTPLRWYQREIGYDVAFVLDDALGEALSASARRAFDTWAFAARGALRPTYQGPVARATRGDGRSTVEVLAAWDPAFGEPAVTIAHTELLYDTTTGEIFEADLLLNGASFSFASGDPSAFDPESVILHEIGHLLGFAHSCGDPGRAHPSCFDLPPEDRDRVLDAVMAPTLALGVGRAALGADDVAAIEAHYHVAANVAVPRVVEVGRDCPSGQVVVAGERFPSEPIVEARYASGLVEARDAELDRDGAIRLLVEDGAAFRAGHGLVDLVVRDPSTSAYGSRVDVEARPDCESNDAGVEDRSPEEEARACLCVNTHPREAGRHGAGLLATLLVGIAMLRRSALRRSGRSRTRPSTVGLLGALALSMLPARAAHAFKCSRVGANSGPSLIWKQRSISWEVNRAMSDDFADPSVPLEEIKLAFKTWEDIDCSDIALPFGGETADLKAEHTDTGSNTNAVVFIESGWRYDPGVIAVTTNQFDTQSGIVVDSDIELNGEHFHFAVVGTACDPRSGVMDLRNALTHEVGHVLGLDHPPNTRRNADATMYASAPPCETKKRTLAPDDIEGLCTIYPSGAPTYQCFPPDGPSFVVTESDDGFGGCTHTQARDDSLVALASSLALVALALSRRRRR